MNKVILVGRLTRDPELRVTPSGVNVCSFTVAVDRRFVKQGEQRQADFINCVAWRNNAEFISKYFTKGRMIGLVGSIQTRTWDDKEGKRQYTTEVLIDEVYFTESKGSSANQNSGFSQLPNQNSDEPKFDDLPDGADFVPGDTEDDLPF